MPEVRGAAAELAETPRDAPAGRDGVFGIGQGQVLATPLQMANVAATFARDGVWVRPRIVASKAGRVAGDDAAGDAGRAGPGGPPLRREALAAAKEGMHRS